MVQPRDGTEVGGDAASSPYAMLCSTLLYLNGVRAHSCGVAEYTRAVRTYRTESTFSEGIVKV